MGFDNSDSDEGTELSMSWFYGTVSQDNQEDQERLVRSQDSFNVAERGQVVIPQPEVIQGYLYPITAAIKEKIIEYRSTIMLMMDPILQQTNEVALENPLLLITGPKFITDPIQAKLCAQWVSVLSGKRQYEIDATSSSSSSSVNPILQEIYTQTTPISNKNLLISMRANLNKFNFDYNDTYGLRSKPSLMTYEIDKGIPICRALLCELCQYCPLVGQLSDTVTPQYMSDLFCLGIVESSMTESQLHRELVSGVSYPVGFHTEVSDQSLLDFKIDSAIDAMLSCSHPHHFLTITKLGVVAIVGTTGNSDTFIILSLAQQTSSATEVCQLVDKLLSKMTPLDKIRPPRIMIDIGKVSSLNYDSTLQLLKQLLTNDNVCVHLMGFMLDSGDDYFDDGMVLKEVLPRRGEVYKNPYVTFEFNNLRSKMEHLNGHRERSYDTLECTNKLIHELVQLAQYRKQMLLPKCL